MDDGEDDLHFDFESILNTVPSTNINTPTVSTAAENVGTGGTNQRRNFRSIVCHFWLSGHCFLGDECLFLHQYDMSRMPVCRYFRQGKVCYNRDCVLKHSDEDINECRMYKSGFCPNGKYCRYRHVQLPGPPPPVKEVLQKIQQQTSYNSGNTNRLPVHNGTNQLSRNAVADPLSTTATPLPLGTSRYFIIKSHNRENIELSVQQGVWATQQSNEAKLNEAFDSVDNVILIFSINSSGHFQGCAKMTSRVDGSVGGVNWKYEHGPGGYGRKFSVKWLKLCQLSFHKTSHLQNPLNENLEVKISRDCQEIESSVGGKLASLLYLEPDSKLMAIWVAAEAKREKENAKGKRKEFCIDYTIDPDIVPYEDDREEEEKEDSKEENFRPPYGPAVPGRGRGTWGYPPAPDINRGGRSAFGGATPDGFPLPDLSGMAALPFGSYGPRMFGDFTSPGSGTMFGGHPSPPGNFPSCGYGTMTGSGRWFPFMSGMGVGSGVQSRPGRPVDRFDDKPGNQGNIYSDASEDEDEAPIRSRHREGKKKMRSPKRR